MPADDAHGAARVRTAELVASLCLATDLGMGYPFEHGLQSTLIAMRLAERLGVEGSDVADTYYAALLFHAGCTADAHVTADVFGGSLTESMGPVMFGSGRELFAGLLRALPEPGRTAPLRAAETVRRLPRMVREQRPHLTAMCEVAQMLGEGVGLPANAVGPLAHALERWDGKGPLRRAKAAEIPLPMRIVHVAMDAALQRTLGGDAHAVRLIGERAGHSFDPDVAACLEEHAPAILGDVPPASAWEETLAREPAPVRVLEGAAVDRALAAMGHFADLVSPHLTGHSTRVAELAARAAESCGLDAAESAAVRRSALVHDLGRVAVDPHVWQKPGPLDAGEWEQVRLHPYHTERVLSRSPFLAGLAPVAGAHHERLDGSGYHRGSSGADLPVAARLLAVADVYDALTSERPHRPARSGEEAGEVLASEVNAGRLDAAAVKAVLEAAGQRPPPLPRPAGLTEREAEVIGMLARGMQTKQVAAALGISVKTADRHIQNAYRKIGVSTRAAATLFAMEHGLLVWGELPMVRASRPA